MADCSDLLGRRDDAASLEGELRSAIELTNDLLEALPQKERYELIDQLFASVTALTARLMLLEDLRIRSAPELWNGRKPRDELPLLQPARLDELRTSLAADAKREIKDQSYLDHPSQGFRIWRWAHAVGNDYTETFIKEALACGESDVVFVVLRGIARSMVGRYNISFEHADSYMGSTSRGLFVELSRLASPEVWREFLDAHSTRFPLTETPESGDDCLVQHLRRAFLSRVIETQSEQRETETDA